MAWLKLQESKNVDSSLLGVMVMRSSFSTRNCVCCKRLKTKRMAEKRRKKFPVERYRVLPLLLIDSEVKIHQLYYIKYVSQAQYLYGEDYFCFQQALRHIIKSYILKVVNQKRARFFDPSRLAYLPLIGLFRLGIHVGQNWQNETHDLVTFLDMFDQDLGWKEIRALVKENKNKICWITLNG
jgi:hypothetical protein